MNTNTVVLFTRINSFFSSFLTVRYGEITKTDRQEGGRTVRQTAMQAHSQTDRHCRLRDRQECMQADRPTDRKALQTHRQECTQADRLTDRQAGIFARQRNRYINRQADVQADRRTGG